MVFVPYSEQLRDPRWKAKRQRIIERDGPRCPRCIDGWVAHVHHRWYKPGKMAWEYPDGDLIGICAGCHKEIHERPEFKFCQLRELMER